MNAYIYNTPIYHTAKHLGADIRREDWVEIIAADRITCGREAQAVKTVHRLGAARSGGTLTYNGSFISPSLPARVFNAA